MFGARKVVVDPAAESHPSVALYMHRALSHLPIDATHRHLARCLRPQISEEGDRIDVPISVAKLSAYVRDQVGRGTERRSSLSLTTNH